MAYLDFVLFYFVLLDYKSIIDFLVAGGLLILFVFNFDFIFGRERESRTFHAIVVWVRERESWASLLLGKIRSSRIWLAQVEEEKN